MVNPKPNFFIVGARKTGTTSMYHYLKGHPEIFMSVVKEPHYFSQEVKYQAHIYNTEEEYLGLFKNSENFKIRAEASTSYLDYPEIAQEIYKFNPDAKILIMLRDPIDLLYAMHFEFAFRGRAEEDFAKELELQKQPNRLVYYKKIIENIPRTIAEYQKLFGKDQVHIIGFSEFEANTEEAFKKLLDFLEIDNSYQPEFIKHNTSSKPRSRLLAKLLNTKLVAMVGKIVHQCIPGGKKVEPFMMNKVPFKRPPLDQDLRQDLEQELRPVIEQIQSFV